MKVISRMERRDVLQSVRGIVAIARGMIFEICGATGEDPATVAKACLGDALYWLGEAIDEEGTDEDEHES